VSEINGYDSPWAILTHAGFNQNEMKTAGFPVEKIAAVLGRTSSCFQGIAYSKELSGGKREYKILSHSLGFSLISAPLRLKKPAFCVYCAKDKSFIDAFWDLSLAVACPHHKCLPADKCSSCGALLRWFRPGILKCHCGASITGLPPIPAVTAVVELMMIMQKKLYLQSLNIENKTNFPLAHLERITLKSLIFLIQTLGKFSLLTDESPRPFDEADVVARASLVLANWPSGYHHFLRRLGEKAKESGICTVGLRKQFETFYQSMFKPRSYREEMKFLRDEFVQFGLREWSGGVVDNKLLVGLDVAKRFVSQAEFAKQMGVRPITIQRWVKNGKMENREISFSDRSKRYIADVSKVQLPYISDGSLLDSRKAAALVGLPVSVLRELRASGHYSIRYTSQYKFGYHESDLIELRKALLDKSNKFEDTSFEIEQTIDLGSLLKNLQFWSKTGKATFVAKYLDGNIKSICRTDDTVQSILFRKADVNAYAAASRTAVSHGALSQHEAAKIIVCSPMAIRGLINVGHLKARTGPDRIRVEYESLKHFSNRYVALREVGGEIGTTVSRLRRLCQKGAIPILSIPYMQKDVAWFIQRNDRSELLRLVSIYPTADDRRKNTAQESISPITRLQQYFDSLLKSALPLPRRGGLPNKSAIARACGFDRDFLSRNSAIVSLLSKFESQERHNKGINKRKDIEHLRHYLEEVKRGKHLLPRLKNGRVNKFAIAKACEFHRNIFYSNTEATAMLDAFEMEHWKGVKATVMQQNL
jgi:hypothetical protein